MAEDLQDVAKADNDLRAWVKQSVNWFAALIVSPFVGVCYLESALSGKSSCRSFVSFGQFFSLVPGLTGYTLRRAFYRGTLEHCSDDCVIGFGAIFSQRAAVVESKVYIGTYALLGHVQLGEGCLIGSRASVISSGTAHRLDEQGKWTAFDPSLVHATKVGENAWIGEGAIIAADVGRDTMVSAGSVVGSPVPSGIMVAGNPARFVRKLELPSEEPSLTSELMAKLETQ